MTYMRAWMSLKFGQIRLLVPIATDRVIMEKNGVATFSRLFFIRSFSYLQVMMACMRARRSSNFCQIRQLTAELAALERVKKSPNTYNGKNGVATFSRLLLIGSISYLQVTMIYMRVWMSLKFGQIRLLVCMATDMVIVEKKHVATFSRLFFIRSFSYLQVMMTCMRARIRSFSYLQVMMTCMRARRSSNFCQI